MPGILSQTAVILSLITGSFFGLAGLLKIFGNRLSFWKWAKTSYLRHHPAWVYYVSGVVELAAGPGLVFKMHRQLSALALIVMILLLTIHPWDHNELKSGLITTAVSLAILGFIAYASA
jgi:uncharacterized membrane protein YphA (DoxX/SURF4 family)